MTKQFGEIHVKIDGVNYWYDTEDSVYKHDKFGYAYVTDISILPYEVVEGFQKLAEER